VSAAQRVAVSLTAWLAQLAETGSRQEVEEMARVLCEYAGRLAWMAELPDPAAAVRFAVSQCEQHQTALHGVEPPDAPSADMLDAVCDRIEGEQMCVALQQLTDMGVRRITLDPPRGSVGMWAGVATGPGQERVSLGGSADLGPHALLQRLASALGARLRQSGRGRLDS
jgi:hypothetical protein